MSRKPVQPELLRVDDLEVRLTRKRVKNLHLRVKPPDGHVEVSAPWGTSERFVREFVRGKRAWIEQPRRPRRWPLGGRRWKPACRRSWLRGGPSWGCARASWPTAT